jgi:hypothetical protein
MTSKLANVQFQAGGGDTRIAKTASQGLGLDDCQRAGRSRVPESASAMSTRLKKKLVNLGVDPSSAKVNESFCLVCPSNHLTSLYQIDLSPRSEPLCLRSKSPKTAANLFHYGNKMYPQFIIVLLMYNLKSTQISGERRARTTTITWSLHWWLLCGLLQHRWL